MISLLASLAGFASSLLPELIKMINDRSDKKHELELLSLQLTQQKEQISQQLEMVGKQIDGLQEATLYRTYKVGVKWVDAYNGTVRPTVTYAFFLLYGTVKLLTYSAIGHNAPLAVYLDILWSPEDQAIFAGIISFYFGQRAMNKVRGG